MSRRFVPPGVAIFGEGPEAELARAVAQAREAGYAEGQAEGRRRGEAAGRLEGGREAAAAHQAELEALREKFAKHVAVLGVIDALERAIAGRAADRAALEAAMGRAVAAAVRAVFPVLAGRRAGAEIAALLAAALAERAPERLVLQAAPATLAAVAAEGFPGDHAGRVELLPDAALAPGAVEIGWSGGGLTYDPAALGARVAGLLDHVHPDSPPRSPP